MTDFGKYIGKHNGLEMLADCFSEDITKEQARACITTYCIIFGVEVDTAEWDSLIDWAFDNYNSWFDTCNEMDEFMCELIV